MNSKRLVQLGMAVATAALFAGCATQVTQDSAASSGAQAATRAAPAPAPAPAPQSSIRAASAGDAKAVPVKRSVYYEYDKAEITAEGRKLVEAHADYLRAHAGLKVVIEGNADERGRAEYNV